MTIRRLAFTIAAFALATLTLTAAQQRPASVKSVRLYVFENDSAAEHPLLEMKIIAGEARNRHQTPMFTGVMREVVFRPYWDVPPRIARNE